MLNALRHQRIQQLIVPLPVGVDRDVLNALRHQRIQQSRNLRRRLLTPSRAQRLTASENPAAAMVVSCAAVVVCAQRLTASENPAVFPPDPLIRQGSRQAKSSTSHETARNPLWAHHSTLETGMALRLRAIQAPFCSRRWPQTQSRHRLEPPGSAAPQPFTPQCLISPPTESHAQVSSP